MEINIEKIKRLFSKNLGFKIVSFIAAFALWSNFVGRGEYILDIDVNINYQIPNSYSIKSSPEYLKIRLKGPDMAMKKFSRNSPGINIDLQGKPPGEHLIEVTRAMLDLPPGVQLLFTEPRIIRVVVIGAEGSANGH